MDIANALEELLTELRARDYDAREEGDCVTCEFSGIPCGIVFEEPKLGFYCVVKPGEMRIELTELNELNQLIQFAKFALDETGDLVMSADFVIELRQESWQSSLNSALKVWEAALKELRTFLAQRATEPNLNAA